MLNTLPKKQFSLTAWLSASLLLMLLVIALLSHWWLDSAAWNSWAVSWLRRGETSSLQKFTADLPAGHPQGNVWLARSWLMEKNPSEALRLLDLSSPTDTFAVRVRVTALEQQGQYSAALQVLLKAKDAGLLVEYGARAARRNDQDNAAMAYNSAWELAPDASTTDAASYLISQRKYSQAETLLRQSLADFPVSSNRQAWYRALGDCLKRDGRYAEAQAIYEGALQVYPKDWLLYIGLGWAQYEQGGQVQQAVQSFQNSIDLAPSHPDGYFALGQLWTREKSYEQADQWYLQAITRDSSNAAIYIARANNARSAGNFEKAIALYQAASVAFPVNPIIYYEMAWAYRTGNQPILAKTAIEKAISLSGTPNFNFFLLAGKVYESLQDKGSAVVAYKKVLALDPSNAVAADALNRLAVP